MVFNNFTFYSFIYFIIINLFAFLLMKYDKEKAKNHQWRVPEKHLFFIALIGGSVGSLLGMYHWHHKTKHFTFKIGMPAILILQIILSVFIIQNHWHFPTLL